MKNGIKLSIGRLTLMIMMLLIVVLGGTFAWLTFRSNQSALVLTIGEINKTRIKLTPYEINTNIIGGTSYTDGVYSDVTLTNARDENTTVTLFYRVNNGNTYSGDLYYTIVDTDTGNIVGGSASATSSNKLTPSSITEDEVILSTEIDGSSTSTNYRVYLWANGAGEDTSSSQGESTSLELNAAIGSVNISGTNTYGETLVANVTDSSSTSSYTYQWYYNTNKSTTGGTAIPGATSKTYKIQSGLVGTYIYVEVTASGNSGTTGDYSKPIVYSNVTSTTVSPATPVLTLSGQSDYTYSGSPIAIALVTSSSGTAEVTYYSGSGCSESNKLSSAPIDAANNYSVNAIVSAGMDEEGTLIRTDYGTNYDFTESQTTCFDYKISPKKVQVDWAENSNYTYIYNGANHCLTASVAVSTNTPDVSTDRKTVKGETMSLSTTCAHTAGTNTVSASCTSVTGGRAKCSNYTLSYNSTDTMTIAKYTPTITLVSSSIPSDKSVYITETKSFNVKVDKIVLAATTIGDEVLTGKITSAGNDYVTVSPTSTTVNPGAADVIHTTNYTGVTYVDSTTITVKYVPDDTNNFETVSVNYVIDSGVDNEGGVKKVTPVITLSNTTKTFTGSAITSVAPTASYHSDYNNTDYNLTLTYSYIYYTDSSCTTKTSTTDGSGAASTGAAPVNVNVNGYYVQATSAATDIYYSKKSNCAKLIINKYTPTITLGASSGSIEIGGSATFTAKVTTIAKCSGTLSAASANSTYVSVTPASTSISKTATTTLTYNDPDTSDYATGDTVITISYAPTSANASNCNSASNKTFTATVTKRKPTVSLEAKTATYTGSAISANAATATYGGSDVTGLSYTYTYYTDSSCKIETAQGAGAGGSGGAPVYADEYYVIATSAENDTYFSANSPCTKHTISPKSVSVSWDTDETSFTYNGVAQAPTATAATGITGETMTLTVSGKTDVGTSLTATATCGSVTGGNAMCSNYTLTNSTTTSHTFEITKKSVAVTWNTSQTLFTYNGNGQAPSVTTPINGVNGEKINLTRTTQTNAGTNYTSTASCSSVTNGQKKCSNYSLTNTTSHTFEIEKDDNPIEVTANTLTYNGSAQALITTTKAQGTVYYSTSTSLTSSNYTSGSTTIPTDTNAGTYTVYYYVTGNNNYKEKSGNVSVLIDRYDNPIEVTANTLTYNGSAQALVTTTKAEGTVYYSTSTSLTSSNYTSGSTTIPTGTNAGTYTVYYYVTGNNNYKEKSGYVGVSIAKYTPTLSLSPTSGTVDYLGTNTFTATIKSSYKDKNGTDLIGTITATSGATSYVTISSGASTTGVVASSTGGTSTVSYYGKAGTTTKRTITVKFTPTSDTTNYNSTSKTFNVTAVNAIADTITVNTADDVIYDGNTHGTTASAVSGKTVTITYYSDSSCQTKTTTTNAASAGGAPKNVNLDSDGNVIPYYAIGTTTANANYLAGTSICTEAITINKASCTCTISSIDPLESPTDTLLVDGSPDGYIKYECTGDASSDGEIVISADTDYITVGTIGTTSTKLTARKVNTSGTNVTVLRKEGSNYLACTTDTESVVINPSKYTITFDANEENYTEYNGPITCSVPSSVTKTYGLAVTLPTTKPKYYGYKFVGWNTSADGTGTTYAAGASFAEVITTDTTLYAVWEKDVNELMAVTTEQTSDSSFLRSSLMRPQISSITFVAGTDGATGTIVDVSATEGDEEVLMWYGAANASGYYDIYIGSVSGITTFTSGYYLFSYLTNLTSINFLDNSYTTCASNSWLIDTSNVEDMSFMFYNAGGSATTIELDLRDWDVSNVKNMFSMFHYFRGLTELNLSGWNTSNVENMSHMFYGCSELETITGIDKFVTKKVTNMRSMFNLCSSLTKLELSTNEESSIWDVSSVINMSYMFYECNGLTELDLSNWDTSSVTDMSAIFYNCSGLSEIIDIENLKIQNVIDLNHMFYGCSGLTELNLSGWDTSSATNMFSMFYECSGLTELNLSGWDTSNVTDMSFMFSDAGKSATTFSIIGINDWDVSNVTTMRSMFHDCYKLIQLDLSSWDTSALRSTYAMFFDCLNLEILDLSGWYSIKDQVGYDMSYMFNGCVKLRILNLSGWDTTDHTVMPDMFTDCFSLQEVTMGEEFLLASETYLPTPSVDYVPNANGYWYNIKNWLQYTPEQLTTFVRNNNVEATYVSVPYQITYFNGSTNLGTQSATTSITSSNSTLPTFSRLNGSVSSSLSSVGWGIAGWSTVETSNVVDYTDGGTIDLSASSLAGTISLTLYAVYQRDLEFYSGTDISSPHATLTQYYNPKNISSATTVTTPNLIAIDGKYAYRWQDSAGGLYEQGVASAINRTANYKLYGVYNLTSATEFKTKIYNGTTSYVEKDIHYYSDIDACKLTESITIADKSAGSSGGWTSLGWRMDSSASTASFNALTANLSIPCSETYYAVYSRTVTFYSGSSKATTSQPTQYYNSAGNYTVDVPTAATLSDFDFVGWSTSTAAANNIITISNSKYTGSGGPNFYAIYSRNALFYSGLNKATLYGDNNSDGDVTDENDTPPKQYYNTNGAYSVVAPTSTAEVAGWIISGWRNDKTAGNKEYNLGATITVGSKEYYAVYSRNIKFKSGYSAASSLSSTEVAQYYNSGNATSTVSSVTSPSTATALTNWTLYEWRADTTIGTRDHPPGSSIEIAYSNVTTDIVYYAVYTRGYTVTYNGNGNTGGSTSSNSINYAYYNSGNYNNGANNVIVSGSFTPQTNGFSKSGYHFNEWNTESDGSGTSYAENTIVSINLTITYSTASSYGMTLYAQWAPNTYTITYYLGNGTSTAGSTAFDTKTTCTYGYSCTLETFSDLGGIFPNSVEDKNTNGATSYAWVFDGWGTSNSDTDTSDNYSDGATFTYSTAGDTNLYAIGYKPFYFYGGTGPSKIGSTLYQYWNPHSTATSQLTSITVPEHPTDYNISGWTFFGYQGGAGGANSTVDLSPGTATPAYNKYGYNRSKYSRTVSIVYDCNGGTGSTSSTTSTQYYNSGITSGAGLINSPSMTVASSSCSKEGHSFASWNTKADGTGTSYAANASYTFSNGLTDSSSVTLYAQWTVNNYYVDLNWTLDGEKVTGTIDGVKAALKVDGVDKGYVSDYWYEHPYGTSWEIYGLQLNGTNIEYSANGTVGAATVDARVSLNTLTIGVNNSSYGSVSSTSLYVKSGTTYSVSEATLSLNDGRSVTATATSATGYTTSFSSWSSTSGTISSATTVTANFSRTAHTYTINYDCNGGSGSTASSSHTYGVSKTLTANGCSRDYHTFAGWSTSSSATSATYSNSQSVSNLTSTNGGTVTLYAVWQETTETIDARRWRCPVYDDVKRFTVYDISTCTGANCNYTTVNGITEYSLLPDINTLDGDIEREGLNSEFDGYNLSGAWETGRNVFNNCDGRNYYIDASSIGALNCRSGALSDNTRSPIQYSWGTNVPLYAVLTTTGYGSNGYYYYYAPTYNCYVMGQYLQANSVSSGTVSGTCTCYDDLGGTGANTWNCGTYTSGTIYDTATCMSWCTDEQDMQYQSSTCTIS